MIISHQHQYIFIKTSKTAGTSIEIALSKYCGENDIITPISPDDEKSRQALGFRGPQNYLASIKEYSIRDYLKWFIQGKKKARFFNHISAAEIKAKIPDQIWHGYYKFCFERNPCERVISMYYWFYWRNLISKDTSISEFIDSGRIIDLIKRGRDLYMIDGKIAVDKVCMFEMMDEELEQIAKIVRLPEKPALPKAKGSYRKDRRPYQEILTKEGQEKIRRIFGEEIELFGYQ